MGERGGWNVEGENGANQGAIQALLIGFCQAVNPMNAA